MGTDGGCLWSKRPKGKKELGSPGCEVVGVWFSKDSCVLLVVVVGSKGGKCDESKK